jgi:hypothetical protein
MRNLKQLALAGSVAALAVGVLPAAAGAHGSVFATTAKIVRDRTRPTDLTDQTQYVVTNHGFTFVLREDNGATARGMINYKVLPSAYRATLTRAQILALGDTGAQPHATCRGLAALETEAAIYAWQDRDPFYGYVPFQSGPAGLEDDPARWIAVVRAQADVDLTSLSADAARAACVGRGGNYVPADGTQTTAAALATGVTEPLDAQVTALTRAKAAVDAALAALGIEKAGVDRALAAAQAEVARLQRELEPFTIALTARRLAAARLARGGVKVELSGPPSRRVSLGLQIPAPSAQRLGLRSTVLARKVVRTNASGDATTTIKPGSRAAAALADATSGTAFTVAATTGDRADAARGTATP